MIQQELKDWSAIKYSRAIKVKTRNEGGDVCTNSAVRIVGVTPNQCLLGSEECGSRHELAPKATNPAKQELLLSFVHGDLSERTDGRISWVMVQEVNISQHRFLGNDTLELDSCSCVPLSKLLNSLEPWYF